MFTDGITNKLIGCSLKAEPEDIVLIRIYGDNTDLLIDRKTEIENFKFLHQAGYAPQLYAKFKNGLAYEFAPGEILNVQTVKSPLIYPLIATTMAKIHSIPRDFNTKPCLWNRIEKQLSLIPSTYASANTQIIFEKYFLNEKINLTVEYELLKQKLSDEKSPVVFCHNDLLLGNILHNNGKVTFIDYEYAAYNYQAYDIGNHFAEFAGIAEPNYFLYPDEDFQYSWIKIYLEEYNKTSDNQHEIKKEDILNLYKQINKFVLASHLYWATWSLIQAQLSNIDFDFIKYAVTRMKEYKAKKDLFLK